MWRDSVNCEGGDVDNETQNTDDFFFFSEEKTKIQSSKNKFKATFYLNHNDTAKTHHKDI